MYIEGKWLGRQRTNKLEMNKGYGYNFRNIGRKKTGKIRLTSMISMIFVYQDTSFYITKLSRNLVRELVFYQFLLVIRRNCYKNSFLLKLRVTFSIITSLRNNSFV